MVVESLLDALGVVEVFDVVRTLGGLSFVVGETTDDSGAKTRRWPPHKTERAAIDETYEAEVARARAEELPGQPTSRSATPDDREGRRLRSGSPTRHSGERLIRIRMRRRSVPSVAPTSIRSLTNPRPSSEEGARPLGCDAAWPRSHRPRL